MSQTMLSERPVSAESDRPRRKARAALLRRLADIVSLPSSRVNTFERAVTADLLVEILREADHDERMRVAKRVSGLVEIPISLVRLILRDDLDIAKVLLSEATSIGESDLLDCVRTATEGHRRAIAMRRNLSEVISEALAERGEPIVIETLLRNSMARLSQSAIEQAVALSQNATQLVPCLLRRPELRPSHAYVLFWWADADARRIILQRFAVSREVLQEAAGDVFPMAAKEEWQDDLVRKALQFVERRQRNRAAVERSPYKSLEAAIAAAESGMTRDLAEEISHLAGVKPMTGAKILTDPGGEAMAVLCKATGLPRSALRSLWRAMRRPETGSSGDRAGELQRVTEVFDMVAVDRAQTVLRYWNWALTSAMTPALLDLIRNDDDGHLGGQLSVPERAAMLALGPDLKR
jgi:uncharacterized protein (DUF2336 family)